MSLGDVQTTDFADFSKAFGPSPAEDQQFLSDRLRTMDSFASDASSFFDEDPFSPQAKEKARHEEPSFQPAWPETAQTMSTLPANSSMQASFAHMQTPERKQQYVRSPVHNMAAVHSQHSSNSPHIASSNSVSSGGGGGGGGGAAARRRMRNQMRRGSRDYTRSESDSQSSVHSSQTPPQSPHSTKQQRWLSSDNSSVGASSTGSNRPQLARKTSGSVTGGSVGSPHSVSSNTSSAHNDTVFDTKHPDGGFRFDAFGLDESQINREVTAAMQEIADAHPDLSFFVDDDFANQSQNWDHSPNTSRTATPTRITEEQDGFVDGFRVNKPIPVHVRQSPTSTERSSLTSESAHNNQDGRINLFKQKAGFHESKLRKVIRPDNNINTQKQQATRQSQVDVPALQIPKLQEPGRRKQQLDVDFFDSGLESSDAEGFDSDVGAGEAKKTASITGSARSVPTNEEKKDDGDRKSMASVPPRLEQGTQYLVNVERPRPKKLSTVDAARVNKHLEMYQSPSSQTRQTHEDSKSHVFERFGAGDKSESHRESIQSRQTSFSPGEEDPYHGREPEPHQVGESAGTMTDSFRDRLSTNIAPKTILARQDVDQTCSAENLRDKLRPVRSQHGVAKSEGGAALRVSTVNAILNRVDADSPSAAKSDVGTVSPAFAQVRLRRTSPVTSTSYSQWQEESPSKVEAGYMHGHQQFNTDFSDEQRHSDPPTEPDRKLTYREKRELELKQQREEEERRRADEEDLKKHDVASQIKRRVASVAQQNANFPTIPTSHASGESLFKSLRTVQKSKEISDSGASSVFRDQTRPSLSPIATNSHVKQAKVPHREPADLVIQPSTSGEIDHAPSAEADAVVSRLLKMKQTGGNNALSIETEGQVHQDKSHNQLHTPKATMMMLNAFLAGRESISSKDSSGSNGDDRPTIIEVGEADTPSNDAARTESPKSYPSHLPALKDDPKYAKFFKMLSVGMPMEVVKHAMTRDGFNPSVMDGDHDRPVGIPLKDDPKYSKYFKMLAIGLPMEAVKHAMERDGLNSLVMDRDHNLPAQAMSNDDMEPKEKDSHRRARLHWKTLRKVTSNSLWAKIDQDDQLEGIEIDEAEFQELFQLEKTENAVASLAVTTTAASTKRGVCVIDPKRANNGGIILARLKMSHDEMADAVDRINEQALTAEQIEHIIEYLPTKDERKALEAYMLEGGQDAAEKFDRLCECEKFMVSMMTVKHAKRKVRALLFKLQFRTCLEDIYNDTVAMESACDELNNSVRLRQLFGIILTFGNRLNTVGSGKQRRAGAFTLDSLLKLKQAKAFDKKTTFLHYIVLIVRRNNEILLRFKDDLPSVYKADKIYWDQCINDLEEVENQLENVRKIALYQARQSHSYRLRRKKREDDTESLSDGDMDLSLEEEVELLRATSIGQFTLSAIKYVSSLRDKVEVTKTKFERLLEYFGDEDRKLQPHELFSIIVTFSHDFDRANEEVFANEKKKQREERKRQAVSKTSGRPPTYSPASKTTLKTSNHQPSMFHVLNELKAKTEKQARPTPSAQPQQLSRIEESPSDSSGPFQQSPSNNELDGSENSPDRRRPYQDRSAFEYQATPAKKSGISALHQFQEPLQSPESILKSLCESQSHEHLVKALPMSSSEMPVDGKRSPSQVIQSPNSTPRTQNLLRDKARLRRQRQIQNRSPTTSVLQSSSPVPNNDMNTPSPPSRHRAAELNEDGAQPLSPRSNMRIRMEQRVLRNRAGAI